MNEDPVAEPVTEHIVEPVTEHIAEQVTEHIVEPVIEETLPASASASAPASAPASASASESGPVIFIVPYRDRESHLAFFRPHMARLLANVDYEYRILFLHQKDDRSFNRGAMKNIGFLATKALYPDTYRDITLVFHDIDCLLVDCVDFRTTAGTIKHFYGFRFTLGGILSMNAGDFERINGFPNFWAWGYEDNQIQSRAKNAGIEIDRSAFHDFGAGPDKIVRLFQNSIRDVNKSEFDRYNQHTTEGLDSIRNLSYSINPDTNFVDVTSFYTGVDDPKALTTEFNLMYGNQPFNTSTKTIIKANFKTMNVVPHTQTQIQAKAQAAPVSLSNNHTFQLMGQITRQMARARPTMSMRL